MSICCSFVNLRVHNDPKQGIIMILHEAVVLIYIIFPLSLPFCLSLQDF